MNSKLRIPLCWKESFAKAVSTGMRRQAQRRRKAGLHTMKEASVELLIPVHSLKRMAVNGELRTVKRGLREYVPESEVARLRFDA